MALTIENTIHDMLLAKDPLVAQIQADNYLNGSESESEFDLTFPGRAGDEYCLVRGFYEASEMLHKLDQLETSIRLKMLAIMLNAIHFGK